MSLNDLTEVVMAAADLSEAARASAEASYLAGDDRFALLEAVTEARAVLPVSVLDAIDEYLTHGPMFGDGSSLDDVLRKHVSAMREGRLRSVA